MLSCLPVQAYAGEKLMLFCGAALKRPMDEIVMVFEKTTDIKVDVVYGAVGTLLAQMEFIKRGIYTIMLTVPGVFEKLTD